MRCIFILIVLGCLLACKTNHTPIVATHSFTGKTMGTTYSLKYVGTKKQVPKRVVDSLLVELNLEVSTYIPESTISILNSNESQRFSVIEKSSFTDNYRIAESLYNITNRYFDPSLASLVNFWGFGYTEKDTDKRDKSKVDELMRSVGFDKWSTSLAVDSMIISKPALAKLDFSASAKGYGVDLIAEYMENQGVASYYIEIGGELRVAGIKLNGNKWTVGVNEPKEGSALNEISKVVQLENESMATSGNYRNYYEEDGITYSHIINPFTGFPERSSLLSASILHSKCAYADGFATACMVMGKDRCIELLKNSKDFEGLLLYTEDGESIVSWQTDGYDSKIIQTD